MWEGADLLAVGAADDNISDAGAKALGKALAFNIHACAVFVDLSRKSSRLSVIRARTHERVKIRC